MTLALVGAGEFLPSMQAVDAELLERSGGRRVVILPTASAPDGPGVPERWARMGVEHFQGLGATATAVMALRREDCLRSDLAATVRQADLIYLPGGKPDHLWNSLSETPVWQAITEVVGRGGVVAGCSAGAMILGGWIPGRFSWRRMSFWVPAAGFVADCVVLPHFDELPGWAATLARRLMPGSANSDRDRRRNRAGRPGRHLGSARSGRRGRCRGRLPNPVQAGRPGSVGKACGVIRRTPDRGTLASRGAPA